MSEPVFLHYSQAELDRNFDQRGWVANAEELIARYAERSAITRTRLAHRASLPYGPHADQLLDVFPAPGAPAPIQIFVHGGRWLSFTKDDYSFVADAFVACGVHTVVLNFSKLPGVRLADMVVQISQGIEWTYLNASSFGGDPRRIYITGHSSGAHLAAMAATTDWRSRGLPRDLLKGATCVSGPYDLEPVMLTARGAYLNLDEKETAELSPVRCAGRISCPVIVAYAENDTDEFRRQSEAFADALRRAGSLRSLVRVPRSNHFEIIESLGDPAGEIIRSAVSMMRSL